jgi:hypothetical protein
MRFAHSPRFTLALAALLACAAFAAEAQSTPRPRPPGTTPLEEPPPIPAADTNLATNPVPEPQVTTRREGDTTIVEYRVNGKMYMQRVQPSSGPAYILMDHKGDGTFVKQDNTLAPINSVPQWVLLTF